MSVSRAKVKCHDNHWGGIKKNIGKKRRRNKCHRLENVAGIKKSIIEALAQTQRSIMQISDLLNTATQRKSP